MGYNFYAEIQVSCSLCYCLQVVLAEDLQSLVDKASEKFGDTVLQLETIHGGVIDDFVLIQ